MSRPAPPLVDVQPLGDIAVDLDAALDVVGAVCSLQRRLQDARARGANVVPLCQVVAWAEQTLTTYERATIVMALCNAPGGAA